MKVSTTRGLHAIYQHFTDANYKAIQEIERQSKIRCLKTSPIIIVDTNRPTYMITVEDVKL